MSSPDFKRITAKGITRYADKEFVSHVDVENRAIRFKAASGEMVDRGDFYEVFSFAPGAIDPKLLNAKAPVLMNHMRGTNRGSVFSHEITDNELWVDVKISRSPDGDHLLNDVEDGIVQNVSFHATVLEYDVILGPDKPTLFIKRWRPKEVSFITDSDGPADFTVGIGRSADEEIFEDAKNILKEEIKVADGTQKEREGGSSANANANGSNSYDAERKRVKTINDTASEFSVPFEVVRSAIADGESIESFQQKAMRSMAARSTPIEKPTGPIGLTEKEKQKFSVLTICRSISEGKPVSGFEKEVCDAAAKFAQHKVRGHMVPWEALEISRAGTAPAIPSTMLTANAASTIAKSIEASSFIQFLYDQTFSKSLGVQAITGLQGDVGIPTELSALDVDWMEEDDDAPLTGSRTGSVDLSPKTIGARVPISRRLQLQSSLDVEMWMRRRMATSFAVAMDRTILAGKGRKDRAGNKTIEPKGILQLAADKIVQTVKRNAEKAPLSYSDLVTLEGALSTANIVSGRFAFVTNPRVAAIAKQTMKTSQALSPFLWDGPLLGGVGTINGYPAVATNLVPIGGTEAAPTHSIIFGNWEDIIIGGWGPGVDLLVNPFTDNGSVRLRMLLDCDIKLARNESFAVISDLTDKAPAAAAPARG